MGGYGQMITFAYMVGGWVWQDAYVIKRITDEKQISWKMLKVGKSQKQIFLPTILSKMPNSALASKIKSKNATFLLYSTVYLMLNVYHWLKDVQMVKISMYWRTLVWRCYGSNSTVLALVIGVCQDISLRKKNVNQKFSTKWQILPNKALVYNK